MEQFKKILLVPAIASALALTACGGAVAAVVTALMALMALTRPPASAVLLKYPQRPPAPLLTRARWHRSPISSSARPLPRFWGWKPWKARV